MQLNTDEFKSIISGLDTVGLQLGDINRLSIDEVSTATNKAVSNYNKHPGGSSEVYAAEKAEFWLRVAKYRNIPVKS